MAEIMYRKDDSVKVVAEDATYWADFDTQIERSKAWMWDRNNDTGMYKCRETGVVRVHFLPDPDTLLFPEDTRYEKSFFMSAENAKDLYETIKRNVSLWFALDMASLAAK